MTKTYYHATPFENLESIMKDQVIRKGCDGVVYLTEKPEDAVKFLVVRDIAKFLFLVLTLKRIWYLKALTTVKHSLSAKHLCTQKIFRWIVL